MEELEILLFSFHNAGRTMKIHIFFRILALCAVLPVFASCIDIDSKIRLEGDGSGTIGFVYTVSQIAINLGMADKDQSLLPIPIGEADFRRTLQAVPGLALRSYSRKDDPDKAVVTAEIAFSDLEALNRLVSNSGDIFTLRTQGDVTIFEQSITSGNPNGLDERTREFLKAFFQPYTLSFQLTAPRAVKKANLPESVVSGREAKISLPITAVAESTVPILWAVEW
jgi:hypothetical protein